MTRHIPESEIPAPHASREAPTLRPIDESHIPGPARLPSEFSATERPEPLRDIADRVGALSDALHDENGLVHRLFAELNRKGSKRELRAQKRHYQLMKALHHISNGLVEVSTRLTRIESAHGARLTVVEAARAEGGE